MPGVNTVDGDLSGVGALKAQQDPRRVVFPEPDSPTSAWVLPRLTSKLTLSSACSACLPSEKRLLILHANGRRGQRPVTRRC